MRIYIASSFLNKENVRIARDLCVSAGHTITFDWTSEDAGERTGLELANYLSNAALKDYNGARTADVLIVLHDDRGRGMATEFGIALGLGIPVFIVGAYDPTGHMRNIFYHLHVNHCASIVEVLERLAA
jgi:hypothetical protein